MTKEKVVKVIKYYSRIDREVKSGNGKGIFYVGKRKKELDEESLVVYEIVNEFYNSTFEGRRKQLLKELMEGKTDKVILEGMPYSRDTYYIEKADIARKIFEVCIYKGLVSKEEILKAE